VAELRRRVPRLTEEKAEQILCRARSWTRYGLCTYVTPPYTHAEIKVMDASKLREVAESGKLVGPCARNVLECLDELLSAG
jgi:hypothetical protein